MSEFEPEIAKLGFESFVQLLAPPETEDHLASADDHLGSSLTAVGAAEKLAGALESNSR